MAVKDHFMRAGGSALLLYCGMFMAGPASESLAQQYYETVDAQYVTSSRNPKVLQYIVCLEGAVGLRPRNEALADSLTAAEADCRVFARQLPNTADEPAPEDIRLTILECGFRPADASPDMGCGGGAATQADVVQAEPTVIELGKWLEGISYDGQFLWAAESGQRTLAKVEFATGRVMERFSVGRLPVATTVIGSDVYTLVATDKKLLRHDARGRASTLATFKECPQAMAGDGAQLWVLTLGCNGGGSHLTRIDTGSGRQAVSGDLGEWAEDIVVFNQDIWVAKTRGDTLSAVQKTTMQPRVVDVPGMETWSITANESFVFGGGRASGTQSDGLVVMVDPYALAEVNRTSVPGLVQQIASDESFVYAIGDNGTIWILSAADLSLLRTVEPTTGTYYPTSAILVEDLLAISANQLRGEDGGVLLFGDFLPDVQRPTTATTTQRPGTRPRPLATTARPPVTTARPPVTTARSPVTTARPPATTARPPVTTARPPATTARPGAGGFPIEAGSWGGRVRSGPGTTYGQVASTAEGDPVTLLGVTDVGGSSNPWFSIRLSNGQTGYQSGSLICGVNSPVTGAKGLCPSNSAAVRNAGPATAIGNANRPPVVTGRLQPRSGNANRLGIAGPRPGGQRPPTTIAVSAAGFPINAASRGGKLRVGPGLNTRQVGSTTDGQPLTLLGTAGQTHNGLPWFNVRLRNGQTGYQWGGIVCSTGRAIGGTAGVCPRAVTTAQRPGGTRGGNRPNNTVDPVDVIVNILDIFANAAAGGGNNTFQQTLAVRAGDGGIWTEGSLSRRQAAVYTLNGKENQLLTVELWSDGNNAVFELYAWDVGGRTLPGASRGSNAKFFTGRLPEDAEYKIAIAPTAGDANYQLVVSLEDPPRTGVAGTGAGGRPGTASPTFDPANRRAIGTYESATATTGNIERNGNSLMWTDFDGKTFSLTPDWKNSRLITGTLPQRSFDVVMTNGEVAGFVFGRHAYSRSANTVLPMVVQDPNAPDPNAAPGAAAFDPANRRAIGTYESATAMTGNIERNGGSLMWTDLTGASFGLSPDWANSRLVTETQPQDAFNLVMQNGEVTGFEFGQHSYARASATLLPMVVRDPNAPDDPTLSDTPTDPRAGNDFSPVPAAEYDLCRVTHGDGTGEFYDCLQLALVTALEEQEDLAAEDESIATDPNAAGIASQTPDPRSANDYGLVGDPEYLGCQSDFGDGTSKFYDCLDLALAAALDQSCVNAYGENSNEYFECVAGTLSPDGEGADELTDLGGSPAADPNKPVIADEPPEMAPDPRGNNDYSAVAAVDRTWCVDNWGAEETSPYYDCMDQMLAAVDPNAAAGGGTQDGAADPNEPVIADETPEMAPDPRANDDYSMVSQSDKDWCAQNYGAAGTSPYFDCLEEIVASLDQTPTVADETPEMAPDPRANDDYSMVSQPDKDWCAVNRGAEGTSPYYDCLKEIVASLEQQAIDEQQALEAEQQRILDEQAALEQQQLEQQQLQEQQALEAEQQRILDEQAALEQQQLEQQQLQEQQALEQQANEAGADDQGGGDEVNEAVYYACLADYPDPNSTDFANCYWANN
jgi:hypothetical protein